MGQRHRSQDFEACAESCCRKHMSNPTPHSELGAGPLWLLFPCSRDCCHHKLSGSQPRLPLQECITGMVALPPGPAVRQTGGGSCVA